MQTTDQSRRKNENVSRHEGTFNSPHEETREDYKLWAELCDCELHFSKSESEKMIDLFQKMIVQSDHFDFMEKNERIETFEFLHRCKMAIYRCYF